LAGQQPGWRAARENAGRRRGSAIVESALVIVPLLAIVFAMVDFSLAVFLRSTFQHAVREGVRYGVTFRTAGGLGHDASIRAVVQANAMGFLSGERGAEKIKIRYYEPGTLQESGQNLPGNLLEVAVEGYQWGWIAPLLRAGGILTLNAYASDRMEGLPAGTTLPPR
jgi:hypothetical protein